MFQRNEGSLDRDIRLGLGLIITFIAIFYAHGIFAIVAGIVALVMFFTAASGFCPIYSVLHINTGSNK